jgi:hypothetical protein
MYVLYNSGGYTDTIVEKIKIDTVFGDYLLQTSIMITTLLTSYTNFTLVLLVPFLLYLYRYAELVYRSIIKFKIYFYYMLVVLFTTSWRHWEDCTDSQIQLMRNISDEHILGIHYWKHKTAPLGGPGTEAPTDIPLPLRTFRYKHSITQQVPITHVSNIIAPIYYKIISTRIALNNALELFPDMPDNQPILCMRPDLLISNTQHFPNTVGSNEYIGIWNTAHRQVCPIPEMGDAVCLTTRGVLEKMLATDLELINKEFSGTGYFSEHYLYSILRQSEIKITYDHRIKIALMRDSGNIYYLTQ